MYIILVLLFIEGTQLCAIGRELGGINGMAMELRPRFSCTVPEGFRSRKSDLFSDQNLAQVRMMGC